MSDPKMPDAPQDAPRSSFTLDLSSGTAGKAKRPKGFVPVVQQTINLTTKKATPEPAAAQVEPARAEPQAARQRPEPTPAEPNRPAPKQTAPRQTEARSERRPSGGTSLADLLDEATLARLRGR